MFIKKSRFYKYCILPSFAVFILAGFLLTSSVNVKAASAQSYFPMVINQNDTISDSTLTAFDNVFGLSDYYWFIGNVPNSNNYYFFRFKKSSTGTVYATISDNGLGYKFSFTISGSLTNFMSAIRPASGSNVSSSNSGFVFSNLDSSVYNDSISYWSNFPIYTDSSMTTPVLLLQAPIVVPEGEPTEPDMSSLDLDSSLNTTIIPTAPSYSNSFNDPVPIFDSSSPVQSLFDIIIYGFNRVHSVFTSFREYLFSWLAYFINILTYLIQKIIDVIKFFVNWLYEQFLSWLTPYLKTWLFIKGLLFDENNDTSIYDLLDSFKTSVTGWLNSYWSNSWFSSFFDDLEDTYIVIQGYFEDLQSYFSKVALFFTALVALGSNSQGEFAIGTLINNLFLPNPAEVAALLYANDEFDAFSTTVAIFQSFPILINQLLNVTPSATIHIPSLIYHGQQIGDFDVDFSWYATYKVYVDVILNAFLIIGYLYWLFITFGSHLRGHFIDYEPNNPDSNARLFRG